MIRRVQSLQQNTANDPWQNRLYASRCEKINGFTMLFPGFSKVF
jgi:hypothetical protein